MSMDPLCVRCGGGHAEASCPRGNAFGGAVGTTWPRGPYEVMLYGTPPHTEPWRRRPFEPPPSRPVDPAEIAKLFPKPDADAATRHAELMDELRTLRQAIEALRRDLPGLLAVAIGAGIAGATTKPKPKRRAKRRSKG